MREKDKSEEQLISELTILRQRVADLEKDLSERKRVDEVLQKSETKFRMLVEKMPDAVTYMHAVDENSSLLYASPQVEKIVGYTARELEQRSGGWIDRIHPEDTERVASAFRRSAETGRQFVAEYRVIRKDGSVVWLHDVADRMRDEQGRLSSVLGIAFDISRSKRAEEGLRESEEKYRNIFENATEGIYQTTPEGCYLSVNPAFARTFGYLSPEEMMAEVTDIGRQIYVHPEDRKRLQKLLTTKGRVERVETQVYHRDRRIIWISINARAVRDATGTVLYYEGTNEDITERKQAEEALRRNEEKYRELVENAYSIILRMDKAGNITFFNEFAQRFFGYSEGEILGKCVVGTIVPEVESTGRELRSMIEDIGVNPDRHITGMNENMRRNGERIWVAWTNKPIRDECGQVAEVLCIGNDITELRRAEEELQKLASVVRYSSELINLATLDGKMVFLNDAGAKALGIDPEEVEKADIMQVIPDHLRETVQNELLPTVMKHGAWEGDLQCRNLKTGKLTDVHTMAFTIKDPITGAPVLLANVSRDISERKRAEEALEAKSLDLEEINTALRVLLKRREEDQKEFGANVLSNLKELVFPYIEKLKNSYLNEMQKTYLSILKSHLEEIGAPFLRKLSGEFRNLSPMERQIASLIREGKRNKEISEILGVSVNTILTHRYHLRTKLGLKNKDINLISYLKSINT